MRNKMIKKIALLALLVSLAIVLSIVESFFSLGIPGVKLGLANVVVLVVLYTFNFWYALGISLLRVFISSLLLGNIFQIGFFMSLSGGLLSLCAMFLMKTIFKKFSMVGVSVVGSIFHVAGQIIIAMIFMETYLILYYFPIIFVSAIITGILTGIIALNLTKLNIFKNISFKKEEMKK